MSKTAFCMWHCAVLWAPECKNAVCTCAALTEGSYYSLHIPFRCELWSTVCKCVKLTQFYSEVLNVILSQGFSKRSSGQVIWWGRRCGHRPSQGEAQRRPGTCTSSLSVIKRPIQAPKHRCASPWPGQWLHLLCHQCSTGRVKRKQYTDLWIPSN